MQVEYTDMLWLAVSLFTDAALSSGLLTKFNPATVDGERQYTELNTGEWWGNTEAAMNARLTVLCVLFLSVCCCTYAPLPCRVPFCCR
jgi:hypothetical protein